MSRIWLLSGAGLGFLCVALGAFGAHALRGVLDNYGREVYAKAVQYQMFHSLALLALGILQQQYQQLSLAVPGALFAAGIVLFSGSLYVLAITGIRSWGAVTPFGGVAFLLGWVWLLVQLLRAKQQ